MTLLGAHLLPLPAAACRFHSATPPWGVTVPAQFLSAGAALCVAPGVPHAALDVRVEYAANGHDFTADLLHFAYEPLPVVIALSPAAVAPKSSICL